VDFSFDFHKRYTFWSGALGGFFLALSYFGADQSQVGRYLAGESPTASKFGLMFNAVVKEPMQVAVLLVGVMVFVVYQFEKPPIFFNQPAVALAVERGFGAPLAAFDQKYTAVFEEKRAAVTAFVKARTGGMEAEVSAARGTVQRLDGRLQEIRQEARAVLVQADPNLKSKDSDYVFITFVLNHLPHGLVGLLVAVIFSAAMSATAATLNALGSTTTVDFYRPLIRPAASDAHYLVMTKLLTAGWGLIAIGVALFANFVESLIEAGNILGSLFYGSILGLFLVAFFLRSVRGTAVFVAAVVSQVLVLVLFFTTGIGYLWYNLIGCAGVILLGVLLQTTFFRAPPSDLSPTAA
jgi:SSS family solute:Na+ symporter